MKRREFLKILGLSPAVAVIPALAKNANQEGWTPLKFPVADKWSEKEVGFFKDMEKARHELNSHPDPVVLNSDGDVVSRDRQVTIKEITQDALRMINANLKTNT